MINSNYDNAMLDTQFNYFDNSSSIETEKMRVFFGEEVKIASLEILSDNQDILESIVLKENKTPVCFFTEEELAILAKMDEFSKSSLKPLIF
jgi:hypothetical protein